jgi:hypothetical protein
MLFFSNLLSILLLRLQLINSLFTPFHFFIHFFNFILTHIISILENIISFHEYFVFVTLFFKLVFYF